MATIQNHDHIISFLQLVTQELVYFIVVESSEYWVYLYEEELVREELIPGIVKSANGLDKKHEELKTLLENRFVDFTGGNFDQFLTQYSSVYSNGDYVERSLQDYYFRSSGYEGMFVEGLAKYRKMLLLEACNLIVGEDKAVNVNRANRYGNTPLHLISALSLKSDSDINFFRALVKTGADPLATNEQGLNILHIMFGGMTAVMSKEGYVKLEKKGRASRVVGDMYLHDSYDPYYHYKLEMNRALSFLSGKDAFISEVQLEYLKIIPNQDGNTLMHEWVLAIVDPYEAGELDNSIDDIGSRLIDKHSLNLGVRNKLGYIPIHYALHPKIFSFLVSKGSDYRARSSQGETPILFILKQFLRPGRKESPSTVQEEIDTLFGRELSAMELVRCDLDKVDILTAFLGMNEVKETVSIPDANGISPLTILLAHIRISAYYYSLTYWGTWAEYVFGSNMLTFLIDAAKESNVNIMAANTWNNKGKSALHTLLDMGESVNQVEFNIEEGEGIVDCLEILLEGAADVNAIDEKGRTAMHIVCRQFPICPALFGPCAQILMNFDPRMDLKDHSGETVHDLLLKNEQLQSICKQTRRTVQCNSQVHHAVAANIPTSTSVEVVGKCRYTEESLIAHGSFGCVYVSIKDEHEDKKSKVIKCRTFALKRLEKARIDQKEIEREMRLLLKISDQCDYIVSYHEAIDEGPFYYIVLELLDGDLTWFIPWFIKSIDDDKLKKEMKPDPDVIKVQATLHMLKGLAFLHRNEFIHRDLKPGNILVTVSPDRLFKIGDFGLVKDLSKLCSITPTRGGGLLGTRGWMAPELISLQSKEHTIESDVFALGLVVHYLLSFGLHPFADQDKDQSQIPAHTVEKNIEEMKLSLSEKLSPEAKHLLMEMLAKSPGERKSAAILEQHFFLWSKEKKNAFLVAVGNEEEAADPHGHPNSALEQCLQNTDLGKQISVTPWDGSVVDAYHDMRRKRRSGYRTTCVLELLRFIRNAYSHKEERSANVKVQLENFIFLTAFPTLVLDVYVALEKNGFFVRNGIKEALSSNL